MINIYFFTKKRQKKKKKKTINNKPLIIYRHLWHWEEEEAANLPMIQRKTAFDSLKSQHELLKRHK
jgi:hypothetical protein